MNNLRLPLYGGLWCLGQSVGSGLFHTGYAAHEALMGVVSLAVTALCAVVVLAWRGFRQSRSA